MRTLLNNKARNGGFTIAEMVICFAIIAIVIGTTLTAYTNSAKFAERAGYELAAQAQAVQMVERARAALWDTQTIPITDMVPTGATNISLLELPVAGTNAIDCTNILTVTTITNSSSGPTWYYKMFVATTTYPWNGGTMTNTMVVYRAPDQ